MENNLPTNSKHQSLWILIYQGKAVEKDRHVMLIEISIGVTADDFNLSGSNRRIDFSSVELRFSF